MSITTQCIGVTGKGMPCKRNAATDSAFCSAHQAQSVPTIPPTSEDAPIINQSTTITLEPLTISEALDSVMSRFDCTRDEALDRLVEHGAITADQRAAWDASQIVETVNATVSNGTQAALDAPIINQSATTKENPTMESEKTYTDPTTPMAVVIPRKDSAPRSQSVKRASFDQDVAYFDAVLKKNRNIRDLVMSEYFACPAYWVPTIKLKPGETPAQRLERDYNSWLKAYARALRERKVVKVSGVFFFPAKISPSAYVALIRAGKKAYCVEYAKDSKLFGDDPRKTIQTLLGLEVTYPLVSEVLATATAYNRARAKKNPIQADVDSAYSAYSAAFDKACAALRAIDTALLPDTATSVAVDAASIADGVTA